MPAILNRRRSSRRYAARRGVVYVFTLLGSLLVAGIALAALQLNRRQGESARAIADFAEARLYARTALELGTYKIRSDPYWRANLGNGTWINNQATGAGTVSLSVSDPVDNDVTKGDNHPLLLTATGKKGAAVYKSSVRLEVGPRIGSCMEVSMASGDDTTVSGATLTSDQVVSANRSYSAGGGTTVDADVEAVRSIDGATYAGLKTVKTVARAMPDPTIVFNYYLANGTSIPYTALTRWTRAELLSNTTFETNTTGWYPSGTCILEQSIGQQNDGHYSLRVRNRNSNSACAAQDLPLSVMGNGNTYEVAIPVFPTAAATAQVVLTITSSGDGVQTFLTPAITFVADVAGDFQVDDDDRHTHADLDRNPHQGDDRHRLQ